MNATTVLKYEVLGIVESEVDDCLNIKLATPISEEDGLLCAPNGEGVVMLIVPREDAKKYFIGQSAEITITFGE